MRLTEYSLRMNRVLDHIDRHLSEPLELDAMADVAHFSRFHFHRVFSAWVGETFGDYLRRRRLEAAAQRLGLEPETPVLEVALSVGFGSGEAFARAFKSRFGCTPSDWRIDAPKAWAESAEAVRQRRKERNLDQASRHGKRHNDHFVVLIEEAEMEVEIVEFPTVKVAYMRHIGPYGPKISEFWRDSFSPWLAANGLLGQPYYGIAHDDPSITPPENCRYDACVEVPEGFVPTGRVNVTTLPGGRYAVAKFHGDPSTIGDAWIELFRDWLPRSGMRCDARPCLEYYPRNWAPDPEGGTFTFDICIPVAAV